MDKTNFPLFKNWFKQFTLTVFMQSFHAIFLMFILLMLSQIQTTMATITDDAGNLQYNVANVNAVLSVIAIITSMSLIKFEKIIKGFLGMEESPVGNTGAAGVKMFMGVKAAGQLGQTAFSGFKKHREASKSLKDTQSKIDRKQKKRKRLFPEQTTDTSRGGLPENFIGPPRPPEMRNNQTIDTSRGGLPENFIGPPRPPEMRDNTHTNNTNNKNDFYKQMQKMQLDEEIEDLKTQELKDKKAVRSAGLDKYLNAAGTVASVSVALGAVDETSEVAVIANLLNTPLAKASTKVADTAPGKQGYHEAKEVYKETEIKKETEKIYTEKIKTNPNYKRENAKNEVVNNSATMEKANANAINSASKLLEKTIGKSLVNGLKDYGKMINTTTGRKMTVNQISNIKINKEVKQSKKILDDIKASEARNRQNTRDVGDL